MPRYFYVARSPKGEREEGFFEAKDESQIAKSLKEQGLTLVSAKEESVLKKEKKGSFIIVRGVSVVEKMMFTRNLRIMISAGIVLPKSLEILSKQVKSKKFKDAILGTREEILQGKTFSEGLSKYPDIFPELFSSMVKVGEEGGRLEEVLAILTRQMEREYELKTKIQGALMYPAVVISAMLGIGALMLVMVIPKVAATFKELKIPLPKATQFVIMVGETLAKYWYIMFLVLFSIPILIARIRKTSSGKRIFDDLSLKVPIVSTILKQTNSAYTTRVLSSLLISGVPIARSLEILSRTLGNVYYQEAMLYASDQVRKGIKLSDILVKYPKIYPSLVTQMIAVGEETGKTSEILEKLADFFEEEVTNTTKNLASIIEPLVMLLIGIAIGFFAISMIQPMYTMLDAVK